MEIKKIEDTQINNSFGFHPGKAIAIIVVFMVVVWGIWFAISKINPSGPKDAAEGGFNLASSSLQVKKKSGTEVPQESFYKNYVKITLSAAAKESYPEKEYIVITAIQANLSAVDITDWKLRNSKGVTATLGKGAELFTSGKVNSVAPIKINGGDTLTISTGRSPVGVSFRMNSCSLYLEQFQDFIPPIKEPCPVPENDKAFYSLDGACQRFIAQLTRCETNTKAVPSEFPASCGTFIKAHVNYNGCVTFNKNDRFFYKKEWKIFLGRT
ncbi:MAG: hypothetical protein WCT48_06440, partial [Candidatus Paceibacterota bacterium]